MGALGGSGDSSPLLRCPIAASPDCPLIDLLNAFQEGRAHLAVICDDPVAAMDWCVCACVCVSRCCGGKGWMDWCVRASPAFVFRSLCCEFGEG